MSKTIPLLIASALLVNGCVAEQGELHEAARVLPTAEAIHVNLPEDNAQQYMLGSLAESYMWTRRITRQFNTGAAWVLVLVHAVVQYPPTMVEGDKATWGPHSDALDPAEWMLEVTELADGTYDWAISGRSKITPEDGFLTLIDGNAVAGTEANRGSGSFRMNATNFNRVDPIEHPDSNGSIEVAYDLENRDGTKASIDMHIAGVQKDSSGADVDLVADYYYAEAEDGSGDFTFGFFGDLDENGSAFEQATIRSRWATDGSGRADVTATDGDLGTDSATFEQCWDVQFKSVYETFEVPQGGAAVGDEADCTFAAPAP